MERFYYALQPVPRTLWGRLKRWLAAWLGIPPPPVSNGKNYVGWTARAIWGQDLPIGTEGCVLAAKQRGNELVHVIGFPALTLHVPLPWPGIQLIPPQD